MYERRRLMVFGLVFFGLLAVVAYYHLAATVSPSPGGATLLYRIDDLF